MGGVIVLLGLTGALCLAAYIYKRITAPQRSPWTDQRKDHR